MPLDAALDDVSPQPARQPDQFSYSPPPTILQSIRNQNPPLPAVNSHHPHTHTSHISSTITRRQRTPPIPLGRRSELRLELLRLDSSPRACDSAAFGHGPHVYPACKRENAPRDWVPAFAAAALLPRDPSAGPHMSPMTVRS